MVTQHCRARCTVHAWVRIALVHGALAVVAIPSWSTRARVVSDEVLARRAILAGLQLQTLVDILFTCPTLPAWPTFASVAVQPINAEGSVLAWSAETIIA